MTWQTKNKIIQQEPDDEIQTPDGQQILVGANGDEVLIYDEGFNNWSQEDKQEGVWLAKAKVPESEEWNLKDKLEGSSQLKNKIPQQFYRRRILTPDRRQILVGASENFILISHGASSNWDLKIKIPA